jgi:hypothetical protein
MRISAIIGCVIPLAACAPSTPPAPPHPRDATTVAAPFGKTWNAIIDVFAADNIPIRTMDRASGFISTDPLGVTLSASETFADCGTVIGLPIHADRSTYNIVARGDSSATVKATIRFTATSSGTLRECTSTGRWETEFETTVKARAEGTALAGGPGAVTSISGNVTSPAPVEDAGLSMQRRLESQVGGMVETVNPPIKDAWMRFPLVRRVTSDSVLFVGNVSEQSLTVPLSRIESAKRTTASKAGFVVTFRP